MKTKIQTEIHKGMRKTQRDYMLREQMRAIQKELGEDNPEVAEAQEWRQKIESASMPQQAKDKALKEVDRLERMPGASPETGVIRTYLDWLTALPWSVATDDRLDIQAAQTVLDTDHYGLPKVKDCILEYLAVRKLLIEQQSERAGEVATSDIAGQSPLLQSGVPGGKSGADVVTEGKARNSTPEAPAEPVHRVLLRSPILCFVGPPGVGKTSLGRSIAHALGRKFVRISLGGVHDEAEIRGHRRTYIGALPGRIIEALRQAGTNDPVFMLDEVDKLGARFSRRPGVGAARSARPRAEFHLPRQLSGGAVRSLERAVHHHRQRARYDPRRAARPHGDHPHARLHRGREAAHRAAVPGAAAAARARPPAHGRRARAHGGRPHRRTLRWRRTGRPGRAKAPVRRRQGIAPLLCRRNTARKPRLPARTILEIIRRYTKEAGVRSLERTIATICRKVARSVAEGHVEPVTVTPELLAEFLGPPQFTYGMAEEHDQVGVVTGLVWTEMGGNVISVEVTVMEGHPELILTGQLGNVMQESARAALSYAQSRARELGIVPEAFEKTAVHVHVPAGAIPKDGPSAGITMATALISAYTGLPVRRDLAMTGEITLRGRILPIGGLKEKVLAAHRAGIKTVLFPKENVKDLVDIPATVRDQLELVPVELMEPVLSRALVGFKQENLLRYPMTDVAQGGQRPRPWSSSVAGSV